MTLSDQEIRTRMLRGELVRGGALSQIGPSCYELRMGNVYYDLTESNRPLNAMGSKNILIKPGHRVVLITQEELIIPSDMMARVASKGSLFSIGLSPVSTYADPGFSGNLGVVTQNISDKYIQLPVGEPIAKVDFSTLSSPALTSYKGQHGFQTQIWPIKHQLQKSHSEVAHDPRVKSEIEEAYQILPSATVSVLRLLLRRQRTITFAILLALIVNSLSLFAVMKAGVEPIYSIMTNLVSSFIVALLALYLDRKN